VTLCIALGLLVLPEKTQQWFSDVAGTVR